MSRRHLHLSRLSLVILVLSLVLSEGRDASARTTTGSETLLQDYSHDAQAILDESLIGSEESLRKVEACTDQIMKELTLDNEKEELSLVIHRNGQVEPCGRATQVFTKSALQQALASSTAAKGKSCEHDMDKYHFESFLTLLLANTLGEGECVSEEPEYSHVKDKSLLSFCDMGRKKTPILLDHNDLVPIVAEEEEWLPCHFHTREGVRITSLQQWMQLVLAGSSSDMNEEACQSETSEEPSCATTGTQQPLHIYAVPAGRVFMFAPSYVGEMFHLPHISVATGKPVSLEVLSLSPRVFDIYNFFSGEESDKLVHRALTETSPTHKLKRSTTGTGSKNINSKRTSENGFDTHSKVAQTVKRRCFDVLGFDKYQEGHSDGLQILRYNETNAYTPHMDYMDGYKGAPFDYDSAGVGGNRFATILLYMSDLEPDQGGETVFPDAWPADLEESQRVPLKQAIQDFRNDPSENARKLAQGSWEESLMAQCRTKLAVRGNSARAVLFYSQHPNGQPDKMSKHGACPVLYGEKWAANLWVWNTPREDFEGAPIKPGHQKKTNAQLKATFANRSGKYPDAVLYYDESGYWGKLGPNDPPLNANTYEGHRWNVRVGDKVIHTWYIGTDEKQDFVLKE